MIDFFQDMQNTVSELSQDFLGDQENVTLLQYQPKIDIDDEPQEIAYDTYGFKDILGESDNRFLTENHITGVSAKIMLSPKELGEIKPKIQDEIEFAGNTYTIVEVRELAPSGLPLTYTCYVRK